MTVLGEGNQVQQSGQQQVQQQTGQSGQTGQTSWRDSLPDDIKSSPALAMFNDIPSLAKSYVHAQSQIGKKGIIPPGDKSTPEEWAGFYKSLGQPELDKYDVKTGEAKIPPEMLQKFKATVHKAGLLPRQAQEVLDWYQNEETTSSAAREEQQKLERANQLEGLKKEWGQGFEKEVSHAKLAVKELGGEELQQYLNKTGLGNDVQIIKLMAKAGKLLGEDKLRGIDSGGRFGNTPQEVQAEITKVMGNPNDPYFDKNHPGHKMAVSQMEERYKKLSG